MVIIIYKTSWIPYMLLIIGSYLILSPVIFPTKLNSDFPRLFLGLLCIVLGIYDLRRRGRMKEDGERKVAHLKTEFNSGIKDFQNQDYSSAVRTFNGLLRVKGITTEFQGSLYSLLTRAYYLQGNWPQASAMSQKLFEKGFNPLFSGYTLQYEDYLLRIELLLKENNLKKAKETINRAQHTFGTT